MSEKFVMRRANGDLFTEEIDGKLCIPVWNSKEALDRYKERNPELLIFLPARLTRSILARVRNSFAEGTGPAFFLLADDEPEADLENGRPITLEEMFPGSELIPQAAQSQL